MKTAPLAPPVGSPDMEADDQQGVEPVVSREDVWFEKYRNEPYKDLAVKMKELQTDAAKLERSAKDLKAEFDVIRLRVVPERFAEDGLTNMKIAGVGRLGISSDAYCTTISGQQEALYKFLKENDMGDLIKEGVNPSSLKSLVKGMYEEHLDSAGELDLSAEAAPELEQPDEDEDKDDFQRISEYVNFTPFMKASVTKG